MLLLLRAGSRQGIDGQLQEAGKDRGRYLRDRLQGQAHPHRKHGSPEEDKSRKVSDRNFDDVERTCLIDKGLIGRLLMLN